MAELIVDINAYLGSWPYRKVDFTTANGLVELQRRFGIDKAVVCSLRSIFYDHKEGDREVVEAVQKHQKRLLGFASVSPLFEESRDDLRRSVKESGLKGLRIFPAYHGYNLEDPAVHPLLEEAGKLKIPVMIPMRLSMEWSQPALKMSGIRKIADTYPEIPLILGCINYPELGVTRAILREHDNVFVETSCMQRWQGIEELVRAAGSHRVLFGSGMPIQNPGPALAKIKNAEISESEKLLIMGANAAKIVSLDG